MSLMEHLLTLYRVDSQVRALRTRVDGAERDLAAQAKLLAGVQRQETELASQARQLQATIHNLETEAQGFSDRIAKLRSELNSSNNDKQYKAILGEVKCSQTLYDDIAKHGGRPIVWKTGHSMRSTTPIRPRVRPASSWRTRRTSRKVSLKSRLRDSARLTA